MRQNALLRSEKGLEVPSTARKKDTKIAKVAVVAPVDETTVTIISPSARACAAPACI